MSFRFRRAERRNLTIWLAGWTAASLITVPVVSVIGAMVPQPVLAQGGEFAAGVAKYKAAKYAEALKLFSVALRRRPNDPTIYYYIATCYHQLKDLNNAKKYYTETINMAGLSPAGRSAIQGLSAIDPANAKSLYNQLAVMHGLKPADSPFRTPTAGTSSSTSRVATSGGAGSGSQLGELVAPQESRIPVRKQPNGASIVDATLNNRSIEMLYDTGASTCVFGKNHLQALGIKPPTGEHHGYAIGIGDGGAQKTWQMLANLKVGQIERRNFPISVQETLPTEPLLGQTFFSDFRYEIDNQANAIRLVRNDHAIATASRGSAYATHTSSRDVPFHREGGEVIVDVQVNGKSMPMIFDTGADTICFGSQHLKALNIEVPDDAQEGTSGGIAGSTKMKMFSVARMKLGPIDRQDVPITAIEGHSTLPHPLLGQTFFGNWKFSIDNANHVIKFHSASGGY